MNVGIKMHLLTLRLPSNSKNFTIPSRFCVCAFVEVAFVSGDPFVSAFDIVAFSESSGLCKIRFVAACLNSLFNWNSEKFRRLFVVNLKTFNMFQQNYIGNQVFLLCVLCTRISLLFSLLHSIKCQTVSRSGSVGFDDVCARIFCRFLSPAFMFIQTKFFSLLCSHNKSDWNGV